MSGRHPVDAQGRVLPHPGWPEDRRAPGDLELVRRFCNSVNRENGAERFHDPPAFDAWLDDEGLPVTGTSPGELARVVAVREVLHRLTVANTAGRHAAGARAELATLLPVGGVAFAPSDDGLRLSPVGGGAEAFLAMVGLAIAAAVADGRWGRLKACHHCHWVVFDPSKNRSARWCSMSACGGRQNAKAYRRRRAVSR